MLIGPPGSGKSALAQQMQGLIPQSCIISTDQIRQDLYGDPTHQGPWTDIEAKVKTQICHTLAHGHSIIYDATNAKRVWRMGLLQSLAPSTPAWIGWHLTTPLATCHQWNQQRSRTVPPAVIDSLYAALKRFPPHPEEGFVAVYAIDPHLVDLHLEPSVISAKLAELSRSLTNRANRTYTKSSSKSGVSPRENSTSGLGQGLVLS
ncbi:ATP-binding protein [Leptolyngbya sp. PCC 6406]|uniref:ATP-binding protein n=1 Tax=Leptolyngbya sp. PCC 6406 TaxID=1173264 RepID=UPI0002DC542B|nr:ATP-binding protein [Leptolyngbya sp. PCC 6406]